MFMFKIIIPLCAHNSKLNDFTKKSRMTKKNSDNYIKEFGRVEGVEGDDGSLPPP